MLLVNGQNMLNWEVNMGSKMIISKVESKEAIFTKLAKSWSVRGSVFFGYDTEHLVSFRDAHCLYYLLLLRPLLHGVN
jgi:hypothetical protein